MFDRIAASFRLARSSWQVLLKDKTLIVFPLISGFCCLLVMASFIAPLFVSERFLHTISDQNSPLTWAYVFLFYFVNYFVIVFFNSALVACALMRLNGDSPTLGDGLTAAINRLPQIIMWALVSATVGLILRAVEQAGERVGQIVSAILGTAWTVITFFVVPVLVVEKTGPIDAIKRSTSILKQTWGEALVGNFGLGLFNFLLLLPGIAIAIFAGWLATINPTLGIVVGGVALLYFILWGAVSSALNGIFVSALYQYAARGSLPADFEQDTVQNAFRPKAA